MRDLIVIMIIFTIIFAGTYFTQKTLNNTSESLVSELEELKNGIEQEEIKEEEMQNKSDEIYGKWEEIDEKWSVIVLHEELDLIETSLIRMKSKIKTGNIVESMEDLDSSIFLLKHIKEKEKTKLKNIF